MNTDNEPEIESMSYDEKTQTLHIQYCGQAGRQGWHLHYQGVPAGLYEGLRQSASPVSYLKNEIEGAGYEGAGAISFKRLMSKAEAQRHLKDNGS